MTHSNIQRSPDGEGGQGLTADEERDLKEMSREAETTLADATRTIGLLILCVFLGGGFLIWKSGSILSYDIKQLREASGLSVTERTFVRSTNLDSVIAQAKEALNRLALSDGRTNDFAKVSAALAIGDPQESLRRLLTNSGEFDQAYKKYFLLTVSNALDKLNAQ